MRQPPRIFILGDVNVDAIAPLAVPLAPGGDNLHRGFELHLGGVGANVAVALAKCGAAVQLAGCVANDWLGQFALDALARQRVATEFIARSGGVTGLVVIPVNPDGSRTIIGARGANDLPPAGTLESWLFGAQAVHLVGYTLLSEQTASLVAQIAAEAQKRGITVSFDPGPGPARQARGRVLDVLAAADTLFISLEEAETLTAQQGADACSAIATCGATEIVLKRGAGGCQYYEAARWWAMPPFSVDVVDTTGAGDAFAAGYIIGKLRGWGMADCVLLANAMGAAACTKLGAGEQMPSLDDVRALLAREQEASATAKLAERLARLLA